MQCILVCVYINETRFRRQYLTYNMGILLFYFKNIGLNTLDWFLTINGLEPAMKIVVSYCIYVF